MQTKSSTKSDHKPNDLISLISGHFFCRVFQHSVTEVDLRGESSVDAEWLAYLGAFRYLQNLNIADCKSINNTALWPLSVA